MTKIPLLHKELKFVPTPYFVGQTALEFDFKRLRRPFRLKWVFFPNDERSFETNLSKFKWYFNPMNEDTDNEIYFSRLEENNHDY